MTASLAPSRPTLGHRSPESTPGWGSLPSLAPTMPTFLKTVGGRTCRTFEAELGPSSLGAQVSGPLVA